MTDIVQVTDPTVLDRSSGHVLPPPDRNPVFVYLRTLARGSHRTAIGSLQRAMDVVTNGQATMQPHEFPWWTLRYQHLEGVRAVLAERYAPNTANTILTICRQVLRHCRRLGLMSADDFAAASDVGRVRGKRVPPGRAIEPAELAQLFAACGPGANITARDRAMIAVLFYAGLRREEVATLDLASYHVHSATLYVHGKGNKQRAVPMAKALTQRLDAWIAVRGAHDGPLFCRISRTGRIHVTKRLTHQTVYIVLKKLAGRAKVENLSPHDMRRSFISTLLDMKKDLKTVSKLAGHENLDTTGRYDRRGERAQREAVAALDGVLPDDGRSL